MIDDFTRGETHRQILHTFVYVRRTYDYTNVQLVRCRYGTATKRVDIRTRRLYVRTYD